MKLHPEHGTAIGLCAKGQRRFCLAHGIDAKRFFREGIDVEELQHIDDENLRSMIAEAEKQNRG